MIAFFLTHLLSFRAIQASAPSSTPSFSPTTIIEPEILARQQDSARIMSLIVNESNTREKEILALKKILDVQVMLYDAGFTNFTTQLLALEMGISITAKNLSMLNIGLINETQEREKADAMLIKALEKETEHCVEQNSALQKQIYNISNITQQWNNVFNLSLNHYISTNDHALAESMWKIQLLSAETKQQLLDLTQQSNQNLSVINNSLYHYVYAAWTALEKDINSVSLTLTEKINHDFQAIQAIIDSVKPNSPNSTKTYTIPEAAVTDIITRQAAAINALDDPQLQEARRMFDLALSCKEAILICIALFNFLILVQGMSRTQSLRYTFKLKDKQELDTLRRGSAGPIGPVFYTLITRLESIIVDSAFTKKERLDRLQKLAEIQHTKENSLSLFSSLHSLRELQTELKNSQELSAVGLLRNIDLSRKILANEVYKDYIPWRRVNDIRVLIYSILQPYTGNIERDENDVLGHKEEWFSRHKHRYNISRHWAIFSKRLPPQDNIKTPKIATPAALILKMAVEFDEKTSPDFSRYLHKLHARLCLIHYFPSLIDDLYFYLENKAPADVDVAIQSINTHYPDLALDLLSNSIEYSKTLLKDAHELMESIHQLSAPRPFWELRRFSSTQNEAEKTHRKNIVNQVYEIFKAVFEHIEHTIPLLIAWMNAYEAMATHAEKPLKEHLKVVSQRIDQSHEEADEYEQKYHDMMSTLSSNPGLPGLVDLIDLSYHLGLKLDQFHLSKRASTGRVTPLNTNKIRAHHPANIQLHVHVSDSDSDDSESSKNSDNEEPRSTLSKMV